LLPLEISQSRIDEIKSLMLELPWEVATKFRSEYGLSEYDARLLTADIDTAEYFKGVVFNGPMVNGKPADPKLCANWVIGEFLRKRNAGEGPPSVYFVSNDTLGKLLERVFDGTISAKTAKTLFEEFWDTDKVADRMRGPNTVDEIIFERGLKQLSDSTAIEKMVDDVIAANPKSVEEYKAGKEKALNALFGQVMKASNKTANPAQVTEILKKKLSA
jgi:aspartyl-tRNA(Asn)/glutamyl-tRNA(Gln) amidotransferase subunit B